MFRSDQRAQAVEAGEKSSERPFSCFESASVASLFKQEKGRDEDFSPARAPEHVRTEAEKSMNEPGHKFFGLTAL